MVFGECTRANGGRDGGSRSPLLLVLISALLRSKEICRMRRPCSSGLTGLGRTGLGRWPTVGGCVSSGKRSSSSSIMLAGAERRLRYKGARLCRRTDGALAGSPTNRRPRPCLATRLETASRHELAGDDEVLTKPLQLSKSQRSCGGVTLGSSTSPLMRVLGTDTVSAALCGQAWGIRSSRPRRGADLAKVARSPWTTPPW